MVMVGESEVYFERQSKALSDICIQKKRLVWVIGGTDLFCSGWEAGKPPPQLQTSSSCSELIWSFRNGILTW